MRFSRTRKKEAAARTCAQLESYEASSAALGASTPTGISLESGTATTGWTTAKLTASGVTLTTHTTDVQHPWNGESKTLTWRSA